MKHKTLLVALLGLLLASANAVGAKSASKMLVQTDWLAKHLKDSNLVVIHVAPDPTSYTAGHIPGARFMPMADVAVPRNGVPNQLPAADALQTAFERIGISNNSQVVIYGDMSGLFAARVYFALDYLGLGERAALLDGGLEKWKAEHREVNNTVSVIKVGSLKIKLRPQVMADLAAMKQMVADKKTTLIDARPPDEYSGAGPGDGVPRGGHLPGAKNVFWMDNLVSKDNPVLKPVAEIQKKYEAAGVKPGAKVAVYCRTGVQASHDYFTLKLLGFDPVLYEGSFFEWSKAAGTPVETGAGAAR
jgi:thiosulfate/3-mercaptopyruvate sulfurtransferase